jgi:hypothetical protein
MPQRVSETTSLFSLALSEMASAATWGPEPFRGYVDRAGKKGAALRTAQAISIDTLEQLPGDLRQASAMVFRLGIRTGTLHTQFALARVVTGWEDYFMLDDETFADVQPEVFVPNVSERQIFAFSALPKLSESSLISLACASGLLGKALRLDTEAGEFLPARGQGTFSFEIKPHNLVDSPVWRHEAGQVEIDALFLGRRGGRENVFVIESKVSDNLSSLAKHKLLYAALAVATKLPDYLPIIPVYVRIVRCSGSVHFFTCECETLQRGTAVAVTAITPRRCSRHVFLGID